MATVTLARPHAARRRAAPTAAALRPAHYLVLVATVAVLNVIGVVMVLSASSVVALTTYGSAWYVLASADWTRSSASARLPVSTYAVRSSELLRAVT